MKKGLKFITGMAVSVLLVSANILPVCAAEDNTVQVSYDLNELHNQIDSLESLQEKVNKAKKADIQESISNLSNYVDRLESNVHQSTNKASARSSNPTKISEFMSVGDSASHSHYSTSLTDNYALLDVDYVDSYGFPRSDDFSCETKSRWYGSNPSNAYKISNSGSCTVYGVNVSLSFGGASVSGATSASDSVSDSNTNAWKSGNTFDCTWGATVLSGTFTSTSTVKLKSGSTPDTTSAKISVTI